MKPIIYATSDLHGMLPDPDSVPECDIFIVAGDVTPVTNHRLEFQASWINTYFIAFMAQIRAKHKIWIAGNHDFICQQDPTAVLSPHYTYLRDQETTVGGIRIYGTPWTPTFYDWAFMRSETDLEGIYEAIPEGIDILISHGPPQGYCDQNVMYERCGSFALARRIRAVKPRAVVCGHIHEAYGLGRLGESEIYNVSRVNFNYQPVNQIVQIVLP
jgi:Icc-related predicted phosphoesterase